MYHVKVFNRTFFILAAIAVSFGLAVNGHANVLWTWAYATESGTFLTDGSVDCGASAPAGVYHMINFIVDNSDFEDTPGSLNEGDYVETQPVQGFMWDGNMPTQWFRSSGTFINGTNFAHTHSDLSYRFAVNSYGIDDLEINPGEFLVFSSVIEMDSVVEPCSTQVTVCHKGRKTIEVVENLVSVHLAHGDTLGPCGN